MDFLARWLPATITAAAIFWLSHQSAPPGSGWAPDYLGHLLVYGILSAAVAWGVTDRLRRPATIGRLLTALALATLYGLSDEFHQSFIPARSPSGWDILTDFLGAAAGAALFALAAAIRGRKRF